MFVPPTRAQVLTTLSVEKCRKSRDPLHRTVQERPTVSLLSGTVNWRWRPRSPPGQLRHRAGRSLERIRLAPETDGPGQPQFRRPGAPPEITKLGEERHHRRRWPAPGFGPD